MRPNLNNLLLLFLLGFGFATFSQNDRQFIKNIHELDSAKSGNDFKKLSASFGKHLQSNPNQWQAYYYVALTDILLAFESHDAEIKRLASEANICINKADSLSPDNSELMVLRSMSSAAMINSDNKKNAIKYGTQANKYADKAIQLNPENPRAYLLKAKSQMNVPAKFGGGSKSALKYYEKAIGKFKSYKASSSIDPSWGYKIAQREIKECRNKIKPSDNGK